MVVFKLVTLTFLGLSHALIFSKYSGFLTDYEIVLPRKVKSNGSFHSFKVNHFFERLTGRSKRSTRRDLVYYRIAISGEDRQLSLSPNHRLLSPGALVEHWEGSNFTQRRIFTPKKHLCHYRGHIRGVDGTAALSLCSGMVGYVRINGTLHFIEPLNDGKESGEQLHVIYKRSIDMSSRIRCEASHDWANSWAEEMYLKAKESITNQQIKTSRTRRSDIAEVVPRFMDLCIVSDFKFITFHKTRDVEEYVLTIMNMVADIYHDASIGNLIDVVVVRLVFLHKEKEEMNLDITPKASNTLESFCKWQVGLNPKDINHPNHHDIAVLLTRHDLCSEGKASCGLLGLAYVGTVCNPQKSCCINEDTGLALAATVAHELGHNMGCAHDSPEESGCEGNLPNGAGTVMAPTVGSLWSSTWSNCSKEFVTNLILNQLGECLLDEPKEQNYESPEMPVGAVYDANMQCELVFGEGYVDCHIGGEKFCEQLWCKKTGAKTCVSKGHLVADGTSCGPGYWCYGKECIPEGKRPPAIDGGWAEWGSWIECTRTCGGGVSMRERLCTNPRPKNGGQYCTGIKRDYKMCNTIDCKPNQLTFREIQCSKHDGIPFKGKYYNWAPYPPPETDPNPCALYCISDSKVLVKLEPRVRDGTRCHPGNKNTCIHGTCIKVGCDWGINSGAIEDICGECNGDGTRCKIIKSFYNKTTGNGYVRIATIPKGSNNIVIMEMKPSDNMLALGSTTDEIYLNGNYTEKSSGEYKIGKNYGVYTKPQKGREEIHMKGPLKEDLVVYYVYFKQENPGVEIKYSFPTSQPSHAAVYKWEFVEWGECSARCGGGTQISKPTCVEVESGVVIDKYCDTYKKPEPKTRPCNLHKCRTRWKTWAWGPCSGCMYRTGERRREVECVMELPTHADGDEVIVAESDCCPPKPPTSELCNSSRPCNLTETYNCTRRRRHDNRFDESFILFSQNLSGVEEKVKEFCKRSTGHWFASNCSNATIIEDRVNPNDVQIQTINLTSCNNDLLGNMSEGDFESIGAMVPKFEADMPITLKGKDALEKLSNLGNGRRTNEPPSTNEQDLSPIPPSTTSTPNRETTYILPKFSACR